MRSPSAGGDPVVVIGGGLAGLAAAARLAKAGHSVQLVEAADRLGGAWAPFDLDGVRVDRAPSVLGFPAPWRDLFRKSGRPLEAELGRLGLALDPAPAARYVFSDGSDVFLPADRAGQYEMMSDTYGNAAAIRWRDLLDRLDQVWQVVRPLGLESELRHRRQLAAGRALLQPRRTIQHLAEELHEPHLAALVSSVAYRLGGVPQLTPAWCAVELSIQRTFGRWAIASDDHPDEVGRSSVLVDALTSRLALRRVIVQPDRRVTGLIREGDRVVGVVLEDGALAASAVVSTADPWQTYGTLLPAAGRSMARARRHWRPALAPAISHRFVSSPSAATGAQLTRATVTETVTLTAAGQPTISYARPVGDRTLETVHDYVRATPQRSAGIAWDGFRSWLARPAVTSAVPGLFLAGPFSPGGSHPSAVVLSGALASYACHDYLS